MMATMGTETGTCGLLQDFIRVQIDAVAACRTAVPHLAGADERAIVVDLCGEHEDQLRHLRRIACDDGVEPPESGTAYEARTVGGIRKAAAVEGDGAVLEALSRLEVAVVADYQRVLRNTALSPLTRPVFERALSELRRHRRVLGRAARLAPRAGR
ncbi:MAG: DUF2383 domain-containing protein [Alphaproteobacteria bacterium]|jgi:uncharacterized protein (TIGR02284 family)|nr:DUF2383 domain-containing protein [Alphaproteobacteria bacterium]